MNPLPYPEPALADEEVVLRPFREGDAADVARLCQDPEIGRWTSVPSPYGLSDAREFLDGVEMRREAGTELSLAIVSPEDDLLGSIGLVRPSWEHGRVEVGYWVGAPARGRSVASRAVRLLSRWALEGLGVTRLELLANPGNEASQRVAERAGFVREGLLRAYRPRKGAREDLVMFSLLSGDLSPGAGGEAP